jgi:transposase
MSRLSHSTSTLREVEIRIHAGQDNNSIYNATGVHVSSLSRYRKQLKRSGTLRPVVRLKRGPKFLLDSAIVAEIEKQLLWRPDLTQEELQWFVYQYWDIWVHQSTISRTITALDLTLKTLQRKSAQRNQPLRAQYMDWVWKFPASFFVFADESACSERHLDRKYGYSPRGVPATKFQDLRRSERWSILPAYGIDGYLEAPLIVKSSVNGEMFKGWLASSVLPQMQPFPNRRSILVMDNCSTHHVAVRSQIICWTVLLTLARVFRNSAMNMAYCFDIYLLTRRILIQSNNRFMLSKAGSKRINSLHQHMVMTITKTASKAFSRRLARRFLPQENINRCGESRD